MQYKIKLNTLIYIVISMLLFNGCMPDKLKDSNTFVIKGKVVDEGGSAISGAKVSANGASATTQSDGSFTLSNLNSRTGNFHVEVNKENYFTGYKNVDNIDGSSLTTQITLLSKEELGTIPSNGGQAGNLGFRVNAPAGGFTNEDGTTYNGPVKVFKKYIDGTNTNMPNVMPGGDFTATDNNGNEGGMQTYGFTATEFVDINGNKLKATTNVQIAVTVPNAVGDPINKGANLWNFDKDKGKWTGSSVVNRNGNEYYFPAITLYQNIDNFISIGTLQGLVLCSNGKPLPGIMITVSNMFNKYITFTNGNGKFRLKVEANTSAFTIATSTGESTNGSSPSTNGTSTAPTIISNSSICSGNSTTVGSGTFTANGQTYSGFCGSIPSQTGCGGIDVSIAQINPVGGFAIKNMPQASSGTFSFVDSFDPNFNECNLWGGTSGITPFGATKSGTLTKTGARSFTFSCTVYAKIPTPVSYSVSGSGNY